MNDDKNMFGRGPWWKPAVALFSEVSTWIIVPIILALVASNVLDDHYGVMQIRLLILTGVAFLLSSYGIVKTVKKYQKKLQDKENQK